MKKLYRAIAAVLATLIMMSVVLTANATAFSDVDADTLGQEVFDAIMYVSDNGIMTGNGDGTFTPNAAMTRAQLAKLLYNHSGASGSYGTVPFTDVPTSAWYYDAVSWAYNNGIVNGYTDTLFNPNGAVTREQTVTMLYRYATDYLGYSFSVSSTLITSHSDYANISTYARTPMNWALAYNIIIPANSSSALLPKTNTIRSTIAEYMFAFEVHVVGYSVEKRLNFINSKTAFGIDGSTPEYYISADMLNRLKNKINSYYGTESADADRLLSSVSNYLSKDWSGACHGMAMVTYLDACGKIDFNANSGNYASMASVPAPRTNESVKSGIHYYQLSYWVGADFVIRYVKDTGNSAENLLAGIDALIDEVDRNGSAVFSFFYYTTGTAGNTSAHSVVITDIVYSGNQTYNVTVLNPNSIGETTMTMVLNRTNGGVTFNGKSLYALEYVSKESADAMSFFDVDGEYNNLFITGGTPGIPFLNDNSSDDALTKTAKVNLHTDSLAGKMLVEVPCIPFELETADGTRLKYSDGELSGDMTVYSNRFLSNGEGNVPSMMLVIDDSRSISYICNTGNGSFFACGDYFCVGAQGSGVSEVYADGSIYVVNGENFEGTVTISTNIDKWERLSLRCTADSQLVVDCGNALSVNGTTGEIGLRFSNLHLEFASEITVMSEPKGVTLDLSQLESKSMISQISAECDKKIFKVSCDDSNNGANGGA